MRVAGIAALVVSGFLYVQMILGGAMLIDRTTNVHTSLGHFIPLLALIAAIILWRTKPPSRLLRWGGILLFVLTAIQAEVLGTQIDPVPTTDRLFLAAHGINAVLIFAFTLVLAVVAIREVPRVQPSK